MNILPKEKQIQIVNALVEGVSVRATSRMVGVEHKTVLRVLLRAGERCQRLLDGRLRNIQARFIQVDEIWSYVMVKERHMTEKHDPECQGDQYIFVAIDAESKLVPCFLVGKRNATNAYHLMKDLQERLASRVQLTTDGFKPYVSAVEDAFGASIDYAMCIKVYRGDESTRERYSPSEISEVVPIPISGDPQRWAISTSYIERQNLTMRMAMRRLTRLTNGFSKKIENLKAALALHFAWYNFVRVHSSLRVTPAMAAGIETRTWELEELLTN